MNHNKNPDYLGTISIIPLNEPVMLTTERVKRAEKLDVPQLSIPIRYATFFSICKGISVNGDWLYVEDTEEKKNTYSRIWGLPITRIRVVVETIFTFRDDMPAHITKWSDAIPYLQDAGDGNALDILNQSKLYRVLPLLRRPYVDRDPLRRTRINTNCKSEVILSHHVKQWAPNWGPVLGYMSDDSNYASSTSSMEAAEFITKGKVPTTSPTSYTMHDSLAKSMVFSR